MANKHTSAQVFFLVDGLSYLASKLQGLKWKIMNETEPSHGLGDSWHEHSPTGMRAVELTQEGGFFETASQHAALSALTADPQAAGAVVVTGKSGDTLAEKFIGFEKVIKVEYEVLAQVGQLTRANAVNRASGQGEEGVILHPLGEETTDGDTESGSVNNGASSADGAAAFLQLTALDLDGHDGFLVTVRDSADDAVYADLVAFTERTAVGAERVTVAGTVEQYAAVSWAFTGSGTAPSATFWAGLARY